MAITTNMSDYEIETGSIDADYDDEILCAGWNPDVDLACQHLPLEPSDSYLSMPSDLTTEVSELFMRRMYSYQE